MSLKGQSLNHSSTTHGRENRVGRFEGLRLLLFLIESPHESKGDHSRSGRRRLLG